LCIFGVKNKIFGVKKIDPKKISPFSIGKRFDTKRAERIAAGIGGNVQARVFTR